MLDAQPFEELQRRFGDRFSAMQLVHIEVIHWPVWQHALTYLSYEYVMLDPLEEGLLLIVQAGCEEIREAASLLGCSERYTREMCARLSGVGSYACLRNSGENGILPTDNTAAVLQTHKRRVPLQKTVTLLRDATYGYWLSHGDVQFELASVPNPEDGHQRWLGPVLPAVHQREEATDYALTLISDPEISESEWDEVGDLRWATLWSGCYQPASGAQGRYLLFNPACEDSPLLDLTLAFEQDLGRNPVKLYFADGPLGTGELYWEGLAERIAADRRTEEIESNKVHLAEAAAEIQRLSKTIDPSGTSDSPIDLSSGDTPSVVQRRLSIERHVADVEFRIAELERQLATAPRLEHLEARDHPAVLRKAIQHATQLLILICPWIRTRVLRSLLPEIDAALRRGVYILIGYGMPTSQRHRDGNDEEALAALRERQSGEQLWLVHLGTHEKVLIQDDQLFVNTSFNFLSYTGTDGRRESGTLQRGGVSAIRNKFLSAFPQHVQDAVEGAITSYE